MLPVGVLSASFRSVVDYLVATVFPPLAAILDQVSSNLCVTRLVRVSPLREGSGGLGSVCWQQSGVVVTLVELHLIGLAVVRWRK